jgi:hypothetical protein
MTAQMTSQILAKHTRVLRLNKDKLHMTKSEEVVRTYNIREVAKISTCANQGYVRCYEVAYSNEISMYSI